MGVGIWRPHWRYPNVADVPKPCREERVDKGSPLRGAADVTGDAGEQGLIEGGYGPIVIGVDPASPGSDITVDGNDGKVSDEPGK